MVFEELEPEVQQKLEQVESALRNLREIIAYTPANVLVDKLSKLILDCLELILVKDDVSVMSEMSYFYEILRQGKPKLACEWLLLRLRVPGHLAWIYRKLQLAVTLSTNDIVGNYEGEVKKTSNGVVFTSIHDYEVAQMLEHELGIKVGKELRKVVEIYGKVLKEIGERVESGLLKMFGQYMRLTPMWKQYFQFVPGFDDDWLGYVYIFCKPWRFDVFGKFARYVGVIPRKIYEQQGRHWHRKAKGVIYMLLQFKLLKSNEYYRNIFEKKILPKEKDKLRTQGVLEEMLEDLAFKYARKEMAYIVSHHIWWMFRKSINLPVHRPYPVEHQPNKHPTYYPPAIKKGKKYWINLETGDLLTIV